MHKVVKWFRDVKEKLISSDESTSNMQLNVHGKHVLVAGLGDPQLLIRLSENGASVEGWDINTELVSKVRTSNPSLVVRQFPADQPWSQGGTQRFDIVVIKDLLDRLVYPGAFLQFLRQVTSEIWIDTIVTDTAERLCMPVDMNGKGGCVMSSAWIHNILSRLDFDVQMAQPDALGITDDAYTWKENFDRGQIRDDRPLRRVFFAEQMDRPCNYTPIVVHVHVPKNGGSSLRNLLDDSFGSDHLNMYTRDPKEWHTYETILRALHQNPNAKIMSSHSFRTFPHMLGTRVPLYMCFLRNPFERHVSFYRYLKKTWDTEISEEHKKILPNNFPDMSMVDFFEWQEAEDRRLGVTPNRQVHYFARINNLNIAKEVLDDFLFVGITEEMGRGISLLKKKLEPYGIQLKEQEIRHDNATQDLYRETEQYVDDPAVKRYLDSVSSDLDLYEWARDRFEREAEAYGV